mmetsp:Transcript_769/g.2074  ORF Transcript_769/g.2074 Transcript_769/m.2074 type:complete len:497 (-) Transcript_769:58-1548(-)
MLLGTPSMKFTSQLVILLLSTCYWAIPSLLANLLAVSTVSLPQVLQARNCTWVSLNHTEQQFGYIHLSADEFAAETGPAPIAKAPAYSTIKRCLRQVDRKNRELYYFAERAGPFMSTGGSDWHRFQWSSRDLFQDDSRFGKNIYLTQASLRVISKQAVIVQYPPVYVHHLHLFMIDGVYPVEGYPGGGYGSFQIKPPVAINPPIPQMVAETHGDSMCKNDQGLTNCFLRQIPEGMGVPLAHGGLFPSGEFNDVRALHSPSMEYWVEVAGQVSTRPLRAIQFGQMALQFKPSHHPWHLTTGPILQLPTHNLPRIYWAQFHSASCAVMHFPRWHTHHQFTRGAWLLDVSSRQLASLLGLTTDALARVKLAEVDAGEITPLSALRTDVSTLELAISRLGSQVLCALPPELHRLEYVPHDEEGSIEGWYARTVPDACEDIVLSANKTYTLMAVFDSTLAAPGNEGGIYTEHVLLWHYLSSCGHLQKQLQTVFVPWKAEEA